MTELEQARAHLQEVQGYLRMARWASECQTEYYERRVKAALSWVWDAQERELKTLWLKELDRRTFAREQFIANLPPESREPTRALYDSADDEELRLMGI